MARTRLLLPKLAAAASRSSVASNRSSEADVSQRGAFARNAYDAIRHAILDCTLLPGLALSEQALSEGLEVSRAPVRDALKQLSNEGLVQVIPQRGTYVSRIDPLKVRDAVFVREVIECRAAELACEALHADKLQLLKLLKTQQHASVKGDYATHLQADEILHERIRHLAIAAVGSHRIAVNQHELIVAAIIEGQAVKARELMREHIRAPLSFLDAIARNHPEYIHH
jgi:GntR family transcriptional regulator, rspAB operon transcriptional repressor